MPDMEAIAREYREKGVEFYQLYTREPHPGEDLSVRSGEKRFDFSQKKQTRTKLEREIYAEEMVEEWGQERPILMDDFGADCVQNWLGGGAPNSLAVIDREGKLAFWQVWSDAKELRAKIETMTKDTDE